MNVTITLTVNGKQQTVATDPQRLLLDVLREDLGLTGTKYGCREGQCGACTVLVDGQRTLSCQTRAVDADKKAITTIEGLASGEALHPVQEAFLDEGAVQCGFCTPGMILTAAALLEKTPRPSDEEIIEGMNGNLCRCNNYPKIFGAIKRVAQQGAERRQS